MFTVFSADDDGPWRVTSCSAISGDGLPGASGLAIETVADLATALRRPAAARWTLTGTIGHVRYVERPEKLSLTRVQAGLGRPEATCAALIPIRKSAAWWDLTQEERRDIFEAQSHHIAASMRFLPAIARQLYHARELGQPFDFLTWFEFAPADVGAFDALVDQLRRSPEWSYVEREVDIRLMREV